MTNYRSIDIIGGGIIGITLATELLRLIRKHGLITEVHLFERNGQLGMENTEKSFEGVRTFWFTPEEMCFYLASIRILEDLPAHFGDDATFEANDPVRVPIQSGFRPVGYHYFLTQGEFESIQKLRAVFQQEQIPIEFYSKDEAAGFDWIHHNFDLNALILDEDDWINAHFDLDTWADSGYDLDLILTMVNIRYAEIAGYVRVPVAGFISVGDVVSSYRGVFERLGGHLHVNTEVTDVAISDNRAVEIFYRKEGNDAQRKSTNYVVNSAGIWSEMLHQVITGESLGVTPHRRYPIIVKPPSGYIADHGMVLLRGRVIRPDNDKIWLYFTPLHEKAGIEKQSPDDRIFDSYFFKYIYPVFCHHKRSFIRNADTLGLYGSTDRRGWLGHYADTPDQRPLIGRPRPGMLENYSVSTGYSGHGVQAAVAAALGLAHEILHLEEECNVHIPRIYSADRDLSLSKPDHSRL